MSKNRELLESVAKLMHSRKSPNFMNYHVLDDGYVCLELGSRAGAITSYWNPLKDDIDAAWLRRELGISIQNDINVGTDAYELGVVAWVTGFSEPGCEFSEVYGSGDKGSAERLAIVKMAAELGNFLS